MLIQYGCLPHTSVVSTCTLTFSLRGNSVTTVDSRLDSPTSSHVHLKFKADKYTNELNPLHFELRIFSGKGDKHVFPNTDYFSKAVPKSACRAICIWPSLMGSAVSGETMWNWSMQRWGNPICNYIINAFKEKQKKMKRACFHTCVFYVTFQSVN